MLARRRRCHRAGRAFAVKYEQAREDHDDDRGVATRAKHGCTDVRAFDLVERPLTSSEFDVDVIVTLHDQKSERVACVETRCARGRRVQRNVLHPIPSTARARDDGGESVQKLVHFIPLPRRRVFRVRETHSVEKRPRRRPPRSNRTPVHSRCCIRSIFFLGPSVNSMRGNLPEFFEISMTERPRHDRGGDEYGVPWGKKSLCSFVVCLLLAYLVYVVFFKQVIHRSSRAGCVTSGMKSTAKPSGDDPFVKGKLHKTQNLTPCKLGDAHCTMQSFKETPPDVKDAHTKKVYEFLDKHDVCMVMVYAPWCPHCHTAMPIFMECSVDESLPFALVNAELVTPEIMEKLKVTHFPFITKVTKTGAGAHDTDVLQKAVSKTTIKQLCTTTKDGHDKADDVFG